MSIEKLKNVKPKEFDAGALDSKYLSELAALPEPKPKKNILPVITTLAVTVFVFGIVVTWAIIGGGIRKQPSEDAVVTPDIQDTPADQSNDNNAQSEKPQDQPPVNKEKNNRTDGTLTDVGDDAQIPSNSGDEGQTSSSIEDDAAENKEQDKQNTIKISYDIEIETNEFNARKQSQKHGNDYTSYYFKNDRLAKILVQLPYESEIPETDYKTHFVLSYRDELYTCVLEQTETPFVTYNKKCCLLDENTAEIISDILYDLKPYAYPITVESWGGVTSVSASSFNNEYSKELYGVLKSFEYTDGECHCAHGYKISLSEYAFADEYDYRIAYVEGCDNAHIVNKNGKIHMLTDDELERILTLISDGKVSFGVGRAMNADCSPVFENGIFTIDGKTRELGKTYDSQIGWLLFGAEFCYKKCECDKVYATVVIDGNKYTFCDCEHPCVTSDCGSLLLSEQDAEFYKQKISDIVNGKTDK